MSELPPSLCYYGSYKGALQILQHSMLPLFLADELGDPFLPSQFSEMRFDCQDLFEKSVKYMTAAILGKSPPTGNPNHPLQKAIRRWRGENRFSDETEIRDSLVGLLPAMVEKQFNYAKDIHDSWLVFIKNKRILPLFENSNNPELWLLEANRYSGVVIKFRCDEDSIFEHCSPVHYDKIPATTVKIGDCVNQMAGEINEIESDYQKTALTQNYQYRTQKEWRMVVDKQLDDELSISVPKGLIQSVYIGAAVARIKTENLVKTVKKIDSKINIYQAKCADNSYEFQYQKISDEKTE